MTPSRILRHSCAKEITAVNQVSCCRLINDLSRPETLLRSAATEC